MENHNPGNSMDSRAMCQGREAPMAREERGNTGPIRDHLDELESLQNILFGAIRELSSRVAPVSSPEPAETKENPNNVEPPTCEVDAKILVISARTKAMIDLVNQSCHRVML